MERITSTLNHLYSKVLEFEMMVVLHILFDTLVLKFLDDVELLASHKEARQYFLFSFLLDIEECVHELVFHIVNDEK
ncbi:MAG: hypothetical protein GYA02_13035 [Clostridiaceae bacterium]|jgi:hypothetical protein|nr:hypothetical protein [Clostridiaceae bacterium]